MIRLSGNKMIRPMCFGRSRYPFRTKSVKRIEDSDTIRDPAGSSGACRDGYDRDDTVAIATAVTEARTGDPMKFDAARAEATFRELGDPRYAGPDGEARVADFLAGRFESMGYRVERREVDRLAVPATRVALGRLAGFLARCSRRITA